METDTLVGARKKAQRLIEILSLEGFGFSEIRPLIQSWNAQNGYILFDNTIDAILAEAITVEEKSNNSVIDLIPLLPKGSDLQLMECSVEWNIDGLIPKQSIILLHGKSGIGKTWLALIMANAISKGIPFMGQGTKELPVVFIDFENSLPVLVDRIRKIGIEDVLFWHSANEKIKPSKLDREAWDLYKNLPPGSLLIFDTLRASQDKDENDSKQMAFVMSRLKELRDMGFTILLLHHTPKSNEKTYKGSTAISDLCDHALSLHKVRKNRPDEEIDDEDDSGCYYRLGTRDKTRYEPFHIFLTFNPERGFELAPDPDTEDLEAIHQQVIGKDPLNQSQIYELVKGELDIKSKGYLVKLLRKGTGKFWETHKEGKAIYYSALSSCPAIDRPDNRTIEPELSRPAQTDTLFHNAQTCNNSALSNCPDPSQTIRTDEKSICLDDARE
jgi:archaellum biogenesis ATPase FlaH